MEERVSKALQAHDWKALKGLTKDGSVNIATMEFAPSSSTILQLAIVLDRVETATMLLQKFVLLKIIYQNEDGNSAAEERLGCAPSQDVKFRLRRAEYRHTSNRGLDSPVPRLDVNALSRRTGATALATAVSKGMLAMIEFLLENGADPTVSDLDGSTAFHHAGRTPIRLALSSGRYEILRVQDTCAWKTKSSSCPTSSRTMTVPRSSDLLGLGLKSTFKSLVQAIEAQSGIMIFAIFNDNSTSKQTENGNNLFHHLATRGTIPLFRSTLQKCGQESRIYLDRATPSGITPPMMALQSGHGQLALAMLQEVPELSRQVHRLKLIKLAVNHALTDDAQLFMRPNVQPLSASDLFAQECEGKGITEGRSGTIFQDILASDSYVKGSFEELETNYRGFLPLAAGSEAAESFQAWVDVGPVSLKPTNPLQASLESAASQGNPLVSSVILAKMWSEYMEYRNVELHPPNIDNAPSAAVANSHEEVLKSVIDESGKHYVLGRELVPSKLTEAIGERREEAGLDDLCAGLEHAGEKKMPGVLEVVYKKIRGMGTEDAGLLLHSSIRRNSPRLLATLLKCDVSQQLQAEDGWSALHGSVLAKSTDAVGVLLRFEANINSLGGSNPRTTALHLAVEANDPKMVEFLVCNGADGTVKDEQGDAPLHVGTRHGCAAAGQRGISRLKAESWRESTGAPLKTRPDIRTVTVQSSSSSCPRRRRRNTPFHLALDGGNFAIARLPLEYPQQVDANAQRQTNKLTHVHEAALRGNAALLEILLGAFSNGERAPTEKSCIRAMTARILPPVLLAARSPLALGLLEILKKHGADIYARFDGVNSMEYHFSKDNAAAVERLGKGERKCYGLGTVEAPYAVGAGVREKCGNGWLPSHAYSRSSGSWDIHFWLLSHGAVLPEGSNVTSQAVQAYKGPERSGSGRPVSTAETTQQFLLETRCFEVGVDSNLDNLDHGILPPRARSREQGRCEVHSSCNRQPREREQRQEEEKTETPGPPRPRPTHTGDSKTKATASATVSGAAPKPRLGIEDENEDKK
ncbi:Ankyrin-1 [Zalerion maritima]|uniref:Ankyrin-1 n=1 Tax=Zalerion maritima TaxID=339359 RepID=A0AAD5WVH2_9PEZI|nr:Ankyrin-1 [Zalerion maritima]